MGGEKQPADRLPAVLVDARTFEMHLRQIILGVRIAEGRRGELEHSEGALRIGTHLAVGYPVQIINSKRDKGARHDGEVALVRVVFVVIRGDFRKIIVSFEIVVRNPVAVGIILASFHCAGGSPPLAAYFNSSIAEAVSPERKPSRPACGVVNVRSGACSTVAPSVPSNASIREPGRQAAKLKSTTPVTRLDVSMDICFTQSTRMCHRARDGCGPTNREYLH